MARTGIMTPVLFTRKRFDSWIKEDGFVLVQPKINGNRCRVKGYPDGKATLYSSSAAEIKSMEHINMQMGLVAKKVIQTTGAFYHHFDGELYLHGQHHQTTDGWCRRQYSAPEHLSISYLIFDMIDTYTPQHKRTDFLSYLNAIVMPMQNIQVVPTYAITNFADLEMMHIQALKDGYEGTVIRNVHNIYQEKQKCTMLMKWKPMNIMTCEVVDYNQEQTQDGEFKDSLGSFVCKMPDSELLFSCGSGLTAVERANWWPKTRAKEIGPKRIKVKYQELTKAGKPHVVVYRGPA